MPLWQTAQASGPRNRIKRRGQRRHPVMGDPGGEIERRSNRNQATDVIALRCQQSRQGATAGIADQPDLPGATALPQLIDGAMGPGDGFLAVACARPQIRRTIAPFISWQVLARAAQIGHRSTVVAQGKAQGKGIVRRRIARRPPTLPGRPIAFDVYGQEGRWRLLPEQDKQGRNCCRMAKPGLVGLPEHSFSPPEERRAGGGEGSSSGEDAAAAQQALRSDN